MNLLGIICEYNPFHFGHKYQIESQKKQFHADGVVCLMSGSFVQRGAPALFDKWTRSQIAVENGADLVLELPVVYSAQSAQRFSEGAIRLLNALNCITTLSFGSECGNLKQLFSAQETVFSEKFCQLTELEMQKGISFPAARSIVLKKEFPKLEPSLLSAPNNILAIEYLACLKKIKSRIKPATHKRKASFPSASEIRSAYRENNDILEKLVPPTSLLSAVKPYDEASYDRLILHAFLQKSPNELRRIADVAEGLEHRFLRCLPNCSGASELAEQVKTKRYTRTRLNRIMVNTLLEITDSDAELLPQYARVLCFNDCGRAILRTMTNTASIPIITKTADANPNTAEYAHMLKKDLLATDIYGLLTNDSRPGKDFRMSPIYVKSNRL